MAEEASQQANRSGMDPNRLVVIFLIAVGLILAMFLQNVLGLAWAQIGWADPEVVEGVGWTVSTLLAVLLAGGLTLFAYFNAKSRATGNEIASELLKVTWPSWGETRTSTLAVVVASVVAAVLLFGIDTLSYKVMVEWLPQLWGNL